MLFVSVSVRDMGEGILVRVFGLALSPGNIL